MGHRLGKQLIYGSIFILIILGTLLWLFWGTVRPAPSCTNGRQNYNEEGIDCGGVCANACLPKNLRSLQTGKVSVFHPLPDTISILGQIQNPNADVSATAVPYVLTFEDASGNAIASTSVTTYLYASEVKNLADFWTDSRAAQVSQATLELGVPSWLLAGKFQRPQLAIQNVQTNIVNNQIQVSGQFLNQDTVALSQVDVIAVLYGRLGFPLGISRTIMGQIAPGATQAFTILHPAINDLDPGRTQVFLSAHRPSF